MRLLKTSLLLLMAATFTLTSCKKDNDPAPQQTAALQQSNVAYGSDQAQKLDLYLPAGRTEATTKIAILIHGGAWSSGDKAEVDMVAAINEFRNRMPDYGVVSINYRLAFFGGNIFPTQEADVKAAVDFLYNKRSEYKYSDKFVLLGPSAGGHLALLQAYKYATPKVKAVISLFGPTDMTQMHNDPAPNSPASGIAFLMGGNPTQQPSLYTSSSPISFANAQSPPTILFHGSSDVIVKYQQSAALHAALPAGVVKEYHLYPGEQHGFGTSTMTDVYNKVQAFLNANVQ